MQMERWGVGVALIAGLLIIACWGGGAEASVEGTVDFGPEVTHSGTTEFYLVFYNQGDRDVVLTYADAVIDWPTDSIDIPDPDQTIIFLDGYITVPAGETVRFENKTGSGFYGEFQVHITVVGESSGDNASTTLSFEDHIVFEDAPGFITPLTASILIFFLIFGGCLVQFFIIGYILDPETRKKIGWETGMWRYIILLSSAISLIFTLFAYGVFSS